MDNDIELREYPREGPSTITVSSRRENRNLQSAAVHDPVCQYPAGASNISNEYEIVEFEDHMLGAHMVHPNKICRICGRGWPDLWMPNVCNCFGERSVVHPGCLQYRAVARSTPRCSVCGVDQFSKREKEKGEEGKKEKREGPSTINVSSRENRNLEPAAVHVQQHPAEALNISNERELMELQDDTLEADMEHPTKICRVCGIDWPELWMPSVCNCSGGRSVVHPRCLQERVLAKNTRRCSVCDVDQFNEGEKEKEKEKENEEEIGEEEKREDAEQEESTLCMIIKCPSKRVFRIGIIIFMALCIILGIVITYVTLKIKVQNYNLDKQK